MKDDVIYVDVNLVLINVREHVVFADTRAPSGRVVRQVLSPQRSAPFISIIMPPPLGYGRMAMMRV